MKTFSSVTSMILVFICTLGYSQIEKEHLEALQIRNIGPAGMSGRVTAIDVDLTNSENIYIGSASGGVWKSTNAGTTWDPIFDDQATLSIGSIKINQSNPDEIWVGTGEGNPRNSHNSGKGIYRTLDGGLTWKCMGLEETKIIHRIHIDPQNPDIIFAGAMGSAWGKSKDRGLYKTIDSGKTWEKILFINNETGVADMVVDPSNPNKIFVAMWEFGRKPWTFNSGGKGSGVYRTIDGGESWVNLSEEEKGFPSKTLGRTGLAISKSNPEVMYALAETEKLGLYRSNDGGYNWALQSDENVGNRPFYYAEIYVDPANENRIFNLWSYVSKSEDGGKTFKTIMDYGNDIHPDHHAFWIHPENPNYLIDGNDGGLNFSYDGGDHWRFVTNLPIGQFYHINVDQGYPFNIYGGMQDNGSWVGPAFALKRGGITNADWQEIYFGDGFDVVPDPNNNRFGYAMSQQGNVAYYDRETGKTMPIQPTRKDTTELRFNWNAPIAVDPFNPKGVYFGSQYLHYSPDNGRSWERLSNDLTTNDKTKQEESLKSGGLTMDVTGAENYTTTLAITPSHFDENTIWVGTDDGRLHRTKSKGKDWVDLTGKLPGCPKNAWIPQIVLSDLNEEEAFVVVNNYRQNDWKPYLYHTTNNGASFQRIVQEGDIPSFVCSIKQDAVNENLLFLGTDVGLYVSFNRGGTWERWESFPPVQIRDIQIQKEYDALVIGTFGRSIWVMDDLNPFRSLAESQKNILKDSLVVFEAPIAFRNNYRSYQGVRFKGQAEFAGKNKSRGAIITVWKKPNDKEENKSANKTKVKDKSKVKEDNKKSKKGGKSTMIIKNEMGDTVRTMNITLKEGMNRVTWRMDGKGVDFPSWNEPKEEIEPGGKLIEAGKYIAIISDGTLLDSTLIVVKDDPRSEIDRNDFKLKISTIERHNDAQSKAKKLFDQLKEAKKQIVFIDSYLEMQEDSIKEKYVDQGKQLKTELDSLQHLFMLPKDTRGYVSNEGLLSPLMWSSRYYIGSSWGKPSENAMVRLENFETKLNEIEKGIVHFFNGQWIEYKQEVEALPNVLFKE